MTFFKFLYFVRKGVYALLFQSFINLQKVDIMIADNVEKICQIVREVIILVDTYHSKESAIDEAVHNWEPAVVLTILSERKECQAILHNLSNSINSINPTLNSENKKKLFHQIVHQFSLLISAELKYLPMMEQVYENILKQYYNRADLHKIKTGIIQFTSSSIIELFEKWIITAMSDTEAKSWLSSLKIKESKIPYLALKNKFSKIFPEQRYAEIIKFSKNQNRLPQPI